MDSRLLKIQEVVSCDNSEAKEISKTIDQQFSGFYWNSASSRAIVHTIVKAREINRVLKTISL